MCLLNLGFHEILCYLQHEKKQQPISGFMVKDGRANCLGSGRQLACTTSSPSKSEVPMAVTTAMMVFFKCIQFEKVKEIRTAEIMTM